MPFSEDHFHDRYDHDPVFGSPFDQSELVEHIVQQLGYFDVRSGDGLVSLLLEALSSLHSLTEPLNESQFLRLSSMIYRALGSAIENLSHRIPVEHLRDGLLSAAIVVTNLHAGDTSNDRYRDAVSRTSILRLYAQICQFEDEIAGRKHDRRRAAVANLLPQADDDVFS